MLEVTETVSFELDREGTQEDSELKKKNSKKCLC